MTTRRKFITDGLTGAASVVALGAASFGRTLQDKTAETAVDGRTGHPLYVDGLAFPPEKPEDIAKSGLNGFVWDVSAGGMVGQAYVRQFRPTLISMVNARKFLRENTVGAFLATKGSDLAAVKGKPRTAVFLQFQSCEPLSDGLESMDVFYELGLRILQMTHHFNNPFAGGCMSREEKGLTELGVQAVEKMNAMGIIPDLSHASVQTGLDVVKTSKKPVIISHTGCRALVRNARCAPDEVIKGVADSGGVIGLFAMSFWLTEAPVPTVDHFIMQIQHIIDVGGIDAVGISNDYAITGEPGALAANNDNEKAVKAYFPWWKSMEGLLGFDKLPKHCVIPELNNVERFFTIQKALEKKGYSSGQIEKIMGGNWLRVLTDCLG
jgi:membrane dipeptidase